MGLITLNRRGRTFRVEDSPHTASWGFWQLWANEVWEPHLLDTIEGLLPPFGVLLDIGAWVGPVSLWAAVAVPGATVVALEPDPVAYGELVTNIAANGLQTRVQALPVAAGPVEGRATLYHVAGLGSSSPSLVYQPVSGESKVEMINIGLFIENMPELNLVKCDIEGGEALILPTLTKVVKCPLIIATHIDRCSAEQYDLVMNELHNNWAIAEKIDNETYVCFPRSQ